MTSQTKSPDVASKVKTSLESTTTTTPQSLRLLRALLGHEIDNHGLKAPAKRRQPPNFGSQDAPARARTTTRSLKTTKKSTQVEFEIFEDCATTAPALPASRRQKYATEIFNTSLKTLSQAAKHIQSTAKDKDCVESPPENDSKRSPAKTSRPLQPCSGNEGARGKSNYCSYQNQADNIETVAECAETSLDCLRHLCYHNETFSTSTSLQQEQGGLALLDKLITLKLQHKAQTQASKIYEQYWKRRKSGLKIVRPTRTFTDFRVSDYVVMSPVISDAAEHNFLSSFQSQLLRLAILIGPAAVTDELVKCFSAHTSGTPQHLTFAARQEGFLDDNTTGLQLRTISLALLKLYSVVATAISTGNSSPRAAFDLLVQALLIKVKSWSFLKYKPDLSRELWMPLLQGAKRLSKSDGKSKSLCGVLIGSCSEISAALKDASLDELMSTDALITMLDLTEWHDDIDSFVHWRKVYQVQTKDQSSFNNVSLLWRQAMHMQKIMGSKIVDMAACFQSVLDSLSYVRSEDSDIEKMLIHSSNLRRVCLSLTQADDTKARSPQNDLNAALQQICLQILIRLPAFLTAHIRCDSAAPAKDQTKYNSFLAGNLAIAKAMDAVLGLRSNIDGQNAAISIAYEQALSTCRTLGPVVLEQLTKSSPDTLTASFLHSFRVHLSNDWWTEYTRSIASNASNLELLGYVEKAVDCLRACPPDAQQSASFGHKLEKLAALYLQTERRDDARQAFEDAICHYISMGAATDATEAALSKPSRLVWSSSTSSRAYCLGRALTSHVKIALTYNLHSPSSQTWIVDDATLSDISRCVIWEKQLQTAGDIGLNECQQQAFCLHIDKIREICVNRYAVFGARIVQNLLRLSDKLPDCAKTCLDPKAVLQIASECLERENGVLNTYAKSLHYSLLISTNINSGVIDVRKMSDEVVALGRSISEVSNPAELESIVDDVEYCCKLLQMLHSYARMKDHTDLSMQGLTVLKHIASLQQNSRKFIQITVQMAILQTRLGQHHFGRDLFAATQSMLGSEPSLTSVTWTLAHGHHLLKTGNAFGAKEMLVQASVTFQEYCKSEATTSRERLERDSLLARAALLSSQIACAEGDLVSANQHARQAVKLATAIWQMIERSEMPHLDHLAAKENPMENLTADLSSLTIESSPKVQWQSKGAAFWDHVDLQYDVLQHLTDLSFHNGLYQDTLLYGEQLRKIAKSIASQVWFGRSTLNLALLYAKASQCDKARELLAQIPVREPIKNIEDLDYNASYAEILLELHSTEDAANILDTLQHHLNELLEPTLPQPISVVAPIRRTKSKIGQKAKADPKHSAQRRPPPPLKPQASSKLPLGYDEVWDKVARLVNLLPATCRRNDTTKATAPVSVSAESKIVTAMASLQTALEELSSDAVKCVLAETAVALPVKYQSSGKHGRVSYFRGPATKTPKSSPKAENLAVGEQILLKAYESLQSLKDIDLNFCSSEMVHLAGKVHAKLALLTSTMDSAQISPSMQLVQRSLTAGNLAHMREMMVVRAEKATSTREQIQVWPSANEQIHATEEIPDLPASWHVISLSMSEDKQELLMSKMSGQKSPFVLRIPLSRSDLEADEDFTFEDAMNELKDIISKANESCHDRRGQGSREERKQWYAERQTLDDRLGRLLANIEAIWLGGFVGLMKAQHIEQETLSDFSQSLTRILDRHLPSRRKPIGKVDLHDHVSELFLSLNEPEKDIDDAVSDLLYFVVDILQFSGERNAYDEIDFDAMLVDTLDAIRSSIPPTQVTSHPQIQHTILILDKDLASIPWESLPCLTNRSVSRLPTLTSLTTRLSKIRSQLQSQQNTFSSSSSDGYSITTTQASYILNPSSDLPTTQSTLAPILTRHLPHFSSTTATPPTEHLFSTTLQSQSLLLYFGHGSGAQYIRGRTIRALPTCAVTLLMGCSSAKMTPAGKLESYGPPGWYVGGASGCMGVVGTLWDVTDRDVDRFAVRLMVEWGLVETEVEDEHGVVMVDQDVKRALEKPKRKGDRKMELEGVGNRSGEKGNKGTTCLSEAVSIARDACALRYLNGAAPVIYGVPVYLA